MVWALLALISCQNNTRDNTLFEPIPRSKSGIDFRNLIVEKETFNIFKYQYFYNGSGLAVGDFNNDGLQDLFFTGNMVKNRLFLNKGNFEFEDISTSAHIYEKEGWCTGVTPVDINADGWLDIYICRAGYDINELRQNLLYINNGASPDGKVSFTEKAAAYGLNDPAHSTQASFFDYDHDGDLDLFLVNHSTVEYSRGSLDVFQLRKEKKPNFTNKLYRNDDQHFIDVTEQAGITSNVLSFSLGISVADLNLDGWMDVFIGNDFNEPDYLFINQKNGRFNECAADYFDHTSMFSMGSDIADINNDGLPDLISLDMLPESNYLQKMHTGADNYDKTNLLIQNGFYRQYSRNTLQLNNGDGTFSEVGQLAGVSNTDWSWSPLFFDFENDGDKDLFIANGYLRDHTDMDFLLFTADEVNKIKNNQEHINFQDYLSKMPPIIQPNYFFENKGNRLPFMNSNATLGYTVPTVTQSAAYADLDNDGDLDLILNNSNEYATILKNRSEQVFPKNHYLKIALRGNPQNPIGIGAKVYVYIGQNTLYQEQNPIRGFQTSVDPILCIGLGLASEIDSIRVIWPNMQSQILTQVSVNQTISLDIKNASPSVSPPKPTQNPYFQLQKNALVAQHTENHFVDFKVQPLLPYFYSREGPALATADVNGDGLSDLYLGGAAGASGQLLINTGHAWSATPSSAITADSGCEDVAACFFDADGDKDMDLYVTSGGFEFAVSDPMLSDRLYINDGKGHFSRDISLFDDRTSDACIASGDMDGDGDTDLFIGGMVVPQRFPEVPSSRLLINNGKGKFTIQQIPTIGLVKDAICLNLNADQRLEILVAAEWAPLQIFEYKSGTWEDNSDTYFKTNTSGLWQSLAASDLDGDGDLDFVAGNLGLNSQLQPTEALPLSLYYGDFDKNGSVDPLLCYPVQGVLYPIASREDLLVQLPALKKKFLHFETYAHAQINDLLEPYGCKDPAKLTAASVETTYFEQVNGQFEPRKLPIPAQYAPVCALAITDVDGDGHHDIILAGNMTQTRVKLGRLDGQHGLVLMNDGKGHFSELPAYANGLQLRGAVRGICITENKGNKTLIFGINDEPAQVYTIKNKPFTTK